MRLGSISLWGKDLDAFREEVRLAERLGYSVIGVGDSPAAWQDMVVGMTVAALETRSATLAPAVTAPMIRHPVVLARAMMSLADLSGGRVVIGLGAGGSAPAALGRKGATVRETREYILALRAVLQGESITWDGMKTAPLVDARPLPIFLGANGPKQQRLAGEVADGVIMSMGLAGDVVDEQIRNVRAGEEAAGRTPGEVEVWGYTYASVRDDRDQAIEDISAFLAVTAGLGMRRPYLRALVPPELSDGIDEVIRSYDPREHVVVGSRAALLVQELGLGEFLAGLGAVAGTPDDVAAAIRGLRERGVSCLIAALPGQVDPAGTLHRFAAAAAGDGAG